MFGLPSILTNVSRPLAAGVCIEKAVPGTVSVFSDRQGLDAVASYSAVRPRGWNPTSVVLELIEKALAEKEKPIRKEEKKGGH